VGRQAGRQAGRQDRAGWAFSPVYHLSASKSLTCRARSLAAASAYLPFLTEEEEEEGISRCILKGCCRKRKNEHYLRKNKIFIRINLLSAFEYRYVFQFLTHVQANKYKFFSVQARCWCACA
jgi:hypothetical protein